jgi:hypothetical protein
VLDDLAIRVLARLVPNLVPGRTLHRRALAAVAAGRFADAEQLFESAALGYRETLEVEALARLRVHQRMAGARAANDPVREAQDMLDIVRTLNRLDQLESFTPPHASLDARVVLSEWLANAPGGGAVLERTALDSAA